MSVALLSSCIVELSSLVINVSSYKPKYCTLTKPVLHQRKIRYLQGGRGVRAVSENLNSLPDPLANSGSSYHPSEDIKELVSDDDARLSDAETAKTLVEVNYKAILMFSGQNDEEIHENVIWPDLPYTTNEKGDVYFAVNNNEDILQTLIGDDKIVQVIIGLDNAELLNELEMSSSSDFDFDLEETTEDGSDTDTDDDLDYDEDSSDDMEDDDDDLISSESSNNWTNLETMRFSHPMYFARKVAEAVSNTNLDLMEQPSSTIVVQGILKATAVEEHSFLRNHLSVADTINDENMKEEEDSNKSSNNEKNSHQKSKSETTFYRLEMIRIQLVSSYGTQSSVEVEDFQKALPDIVVHHSKNIISQIESAGDKTFQALKFLCWKLKNIQVEEAAIIGVDSLGFDMRVCSGTLVQTLRFAFSTRAASADSAERKLHDLLFPLS